LREVVFIGIDAEYALGATALHFERIEPAIAADVEDGLSGKVLRQRIGEALVFDLRVVTEEVIRRGLHSAEAHVMKPGAQSSDAFLQAADLFFSAKRCRWHGFVVPPGQPLGGARIVVIILRANG